MKFIKIITYVIAEPVSPEDSQGRADFGMAWHIEN